ncbi:MAG: hypothetical protein ISR76_04660 [Planctomycetes bacterium]|nr:hypothetical protein [Planctomycetota bacterium]MBL7008266.1 hypothetical protein [Planctomycetota bacterium]
MRSAAIALAALALAGCGYRVLDPAAGGGRAIAVPTAANSSRWRGLEADLTTALRGGLEQLLELRLDAQPPDLVLRTALEDPQRGALVRGEIGEALLGSSQIEVVWSLEDRAGAALAEGRIRRNLEFLPSAGEDARRAMLEILDSIAESVVIEVGVRLEARAENAEE